MSGMIAKSQVPVIHRGQLPADVQAGIVALKNMIRSGRGETFNNRKDVKNATGQPLPKLDQGCIYIEGDVGRGRIDRGKRRLVAEIVETTRQVREIYFSDEHYLKGSFVRVV
ncbi:hypothetical protein C5Y96_15215 [Blastopirellula marina]|uniref:Uncharacterized protein n=1 Tax=Blastopirellula marina TaxID=124 RepID=A0A2S8FAA5_9BACT|nr:MULTISPECIES: hypothetical protein [Pirellulaceae]PQO29103.1 hypothetical protein C5Y96_15215 [Blastopirellula marina]RCS50294.1 hypothetical protein DTL36_15225 [Bremerella cremea]